MPGNAPDLIADEVAAAATALVDAFGAGRVDDYFACFAPDATFVFYTTPKRLESRDAYRTLWNTWERDDGFRVDACASTNTMILPLAPGTALFVHDVATTVTTNDGTDHLHERESIVFVRGDDGWLAVHEHLSPILKAPQT